MAWRVTPYLKRRSMMPKKPIAIDPEVINLEGETQVVSDSGLTIQCYSVYLWSWKPAALLWLAC
jgi:hypothetical protein